MEFDAIPRKAKIKVYVKLDNSSLGNYQVLISLLHYFSVGPPLSLLVFLILTLRSKTGTTVTVRSS